MGNSPFLVLAIILCGVNASGAAATPLKLVQTVSLAGVKGRFDHFAVDVKGQRLFVAALGNNTVEVIDLAAGKRGHSISGLQKPQGVLFLPELNRLCVAGGGDGTLKIFDAANLKLLGSIGSLDDADNLRRAPEGGAVFLGYGDGALAVIDVKRGERIGESKLKGHPESFQLERKGNRIFINVPDARQIAVVDREKRSVAATWPMEKFGANFPMALDDGTGRLFVGCRKPPRLVVLDSSDGKLVADLAISGDTDDLFYDAKRKRLYISCGEGLVDVVEQTSTDHYQTLEHVTTAGGARTSFYSPELDRYYVAVPERGNQQAQIRVFQPE